MKKLVLIIRKKTKRFFFYWNMKENNEKVGIDYKKKKKVDQFFMKWEGKYHEQFDINIR